MEPAALDIIAQPAAAITIYELILNADPIVKAIMAILVITSVLSWAIMLEKAISLTLFGRQTQRLEAFADSPISSKPGRRAWLAEMLVEAGRRQLEPSPGESRSDVEARLEKAMRLNARVVLNRLRPRLRMLATVGSTAPFVGLLGTVWGIMNSFTAIAGHKDTSLAVVAPGIAEALFATALGLAAAIPAVVAYNQISGWLARDAERINIAIAKLANGLTAGMTMQPRES